MENKDKITKELCFVIMPFGGKFDSYWENIYKPIIRDLGYEPRRVDDIYKPNDIMENIWHSINEAKIILADLTGKNPNVFYELGLAHALAKPVILISLEQEDIPFDIQSIRHIRYNKDDHDWGAKLMDHIRNTLLLPDISSYVPVVFKKRYSRQQDGLQSTQIDKGTLQDAIISALSQRSRIQNLRIMAHSTSVIYNVMSSFLTDRLFVDNCELILRKFSEEEENRSDQITIERNIKYWMNLQKNSRINNLKIYAYNHKMTDYSIIIDENVVITGIYIEDSDQPSGISFKHMYYIDSGNTSSGLIQAQIQRFNQTRGKLYEI
ncbi:MAG: hypothetical protein NC453_20145 [Muribaculum sp.]|nr:hypothetical protein [Muribaculum sp.]